MNVRVLATRIGLPYAALGGAALLAIGVAFAAAIPGRVAALEPAFGNQAVTILTAAHDARHVAVTSVQVGSYVHPSFVVSGASGTPTGEISVFKYNNGTCSGTHAWGYGGVLTNGRLDAYFLAETSTDSTTISYRGQYQGDAVYAPMLGPCRSLTFTKALPSIVLTLHNSAHSAVTAVHVEDTVHAFVDVNGRVDEPTGSVKIYAWPAGACSGPASVVGPYALAGSSVDTPFQWPMTTAGGYAFRAQYSGDSTYSAGTSSCFVLSVNKYEPVLTVGLYDSAGQPATYLHVDEPVHVAATLSGPLGTPTGTVTLSRHTSSDCSGPASYTTAETAAAVMDPLAGPYASPFAATLSFKVTYSGDDSYTSATSCHAVTWRYDPTIALSMRNAVDDIVTSVPVGTAIHPRVVMGPNGNMATGQVTVTWSANGTCSGATTLGSRTLVAGIVDDLTLKFVPKSAGTYSFRAAYGGGPVYEPANSACVVVKATAAAPTPTPTPTSKPTPKPTDAVVVPVASSAPTDAPAPTEAPTASPIATAGPSIAPAPGDSPASSGEPASSASPSPGSGGVSPTSSDAAGGPGWIVPLIALLLLLGAFLLWARRRYAERRTRAGEVAR